MSYVDAGYAIALACLCVYAISLVLRRRRWERALKTTRPSELPLSQHGAPGDGASSGGRS
jgi:hypothetical protein